jgi:hypothetical protein
MLRNRITMNEPEPLPLPLPRPTPPPLNLCGFVLVAVPVMPAEQWLVQQCLYQRAFELAQAVVRPSIVERDILGVWN